MSLPGDGARRRIRRTEARHRTGLAWTAPEDELLTALHPTHSNRDLAVRLGRSQWAIVHRARFLQLARDPQDPCGRPRDGGRRWSPDEIETLRTLYSNRPCEDVAECLGRSLDSVKMKARKLQLRKSENWGAAEDRLLCGSYPDQECERIAARLGRTVAAVRARVITLGLETKVRNWTAAEVRFLRDSYRKLEVDRIAGELGRTRAATVRKARALGLVQFRHWSREDAGTLRELYSRCPARELARRLGRPYQSVRDKARRLGLRKRSPPAESGRISPGTSEGNGTDGRGETPGWGRVTRE